MSEHWRYCGTCGSPLPSARPSFCPSCGAPTDLLPSPDGPGTGARAAVVLLSLAVVLGLAGGGYALVGHEGSPDRELVAAVAPSATPSPSPSPSPSPMPSPTPSPVPTALDAAQLAQRLGPAVLRVEVEGCEMAGSGTAFAIGPHHLVTNHHVVSIDPDPVLVDRTGTRRQGRVIGWRESPDLAVIQVDEALPVSLPWAETDALTEGQRLVAIGYPVPDLAFSVTQADIVSFQEEGGTRRAVRTDGAVDRGNSGGPALTLDGQVAGVVTEMADNSSGFQLVALLYTADALAADVDAILAGPQPVEPTCDAGPQEVPEEWEQEWEEVSGGYEGGAQAPEPGAYGDDPVLDALEDSCADGDMSSCDQLYLDSPSGSAYEAFGSTCGERTDPVAGACVGWEQAQELPGPGDAPHGPVVDLAELTAACAEGDLAACDSLFFESPEDSEEETFGATCGGRAEYEGGTCEVRAGTF